jgi:hypothetical protein
VGEVEGGVEAGADRGEEVMQPVEGGGAVAGEVGAVGDQDA